MLTILEQSNEILINRLSGPSEKEIFATEDKQDLEDLSQATKRLLVFTDKELKNMSKHNRKCSTDNEVGQESSDSTLKLIDDMLTSPIKKKKKESRVINLQELNESVLAQAPDYDPAINGDTTLLDSAETNRLIQ